MGKFKQVKPKKKKSPTDKKKEKTESKEKATDRKPTSSYEHSENLVEHSDLNAAGKRGPGGANQANYKRRESSNVTKAENTKGLLCCS